MSDFMYEWIEQENSYCVFDDMGEPILETLEFLQSERNNGAQENTLIAKAVALKLWFEFLDQEGIHYSNVDNKHIPLFRDWLKTPPEHRDIYKMVMGQNEIIEPSTWMQYQGRIATFYERYVLMKYPECKITWKVKTSERNWKSQQVHEFMFKDKLKKIAPDTKSFSPEVFKEIRAQVANKRNALVLDLVYVSGIRRGELQNIDCRQFDLVDRSKADFMITIHDSFDVRADKQTKTGGRCIYITSEMAERIGSYILHDRVTNKNEHYAIFTAFSDTKHKNKSGETTWTKAGDPLSGVYISKIFKEAAKKAGYPEHSIHDSRHSAVTNLLSRDNDLKAVMDQMGHKDPNTTNQYRSKHNSKSSNMSKSLSDIENEIR